MNFWLYMWALILVGIALGFVTENLIGFFKWLYWKRKSKGALLPRFRVLR